MQEKKSGSSSKRKNLGLKLTKKNIHTINAETTLLNYCLPYHIYNLINHAAHLNQKKKIHHRN